MRVCGVELSGKEANLVILERQGALYQIIPCRQRKILLGTLDDPAATQAFHFTFQKLMQDYKVTHLAIRQRPAKGKFAGGAASFKMEAALELIKGCQITLLSASHIKEQLKHHPVPVDFAATGLKKFQRLAFETAYTLASQTKTTADQR